MGINEYPNRTFCDDGSNIINIFVHDGINSVADYNSLRVGVGWMSDVGWMDGCRMSSGANFTIG